MFASKFLQNVRWQALAIGSLIAAELVITLLLSSVLGAAGFGLYAFAYAYCFIANQLCDLRLTDVVITFFPEYKLRDQPHANGLIARAVLLDCARGIVGFLLIAISAWILVPILWHTSNVVSDVLLMGVYLLFNHLLLGSSRGYFRSTDRFAILAIVQALAAVIKVIAVVAALLIDSKNIGYLFIALSIAGAFSLIIQIPFLHRTLSNDGLNFKSPFKNNNLIDKDKILRFIWHNYLAGLSTIVTKDLDVIILSTISGPASVGVYRLAKSLSAGIGNLWDTMFLVLFPEISKLTATDDRKSLRVLIKRIIIFGFPAALSAVIFGYLAVDLLIGYFYKDAGYDSVPWLFAIISLRFLVWVPLLWLNPLIMSHRQAHLTAIGAWIGASFMVVGFMALITLWGATGAAIIIALSSPVVLLPILYLAYRKNIVPV